MPYSKMMHFAQPVCYFHCLKEYLKLSLWTTFGGGDECFVDRSYLCC